MRKFFRKLFSPAVISIVLIALQLALLVLIFVYLDTYVWIAQLVLELAAIPVAFIAVNSRMDNNYKIAWLFFIILLPLFGIIFYLIFANKKFSKKKLRTLKDTSDMINSVLSSSDKANVIDQIDREKDGDCYAIAQYVQNTSNSKIFTNTKTTYYKWGEEGFEVIKEKLQAAKHSIFLEFFIIDYGKMWDETLEILKAKAQEGVDVRVIYDDVGCLGLLPRSYPKELEKYGIKCFDFNKMRPIVDIRMNNRNHRKLLIIDGYIGFTGGFNFADEYINEKVRFGKWKDNVIMLEGDAVFDMSALFMTDWLYNDKKKRGFDDYSEYLPSKYGDTEEFKKGEGYVLPYASFPYTFESAGLNVYLNIIARAKKYLYISTPYLIPNKEIENAIKLSAKSGVDVRILVPGIPDKKTVNQVTKSYYRTLLESGVKIYEYTPGFNHAKMFIADDSMATVGSINLDYRSMFLHLENGTFLYKTSCLADIKDDFNECFNVSKVVTLEQVKKTNPFVVFSRLVLKIFAPLL